jgi:hypothetical protein
MQNWNDQGVGQGAGAQRSNHHVPNRNATTHIYMTCIVAP